MSSSLVNSLAKVYDSKTLQQKHVPAKPHAESEKPPVAVARDGFNLMETRMESLSDKMDRLIDIQETVLSRLQDMSQDMETLRGAREEEEEEEDGGGGGGGDVTGLCREMSTIMSAVNQRSEQQAVKLEGMERLVLGIQQVIGFIGETVKSSRLMELVFNRPPAARKGEKPAVAKEKPPKPSAKEKPAKPTIKEKPAKHASKEKSPKPVAKEKSPKPVAKEKATKPVAKEKPAKAASKEKPVKPIAQEKAAMFHDKGKKTHKRKSLIDLLRDHRGKDGKEKARLTFKGLKSQKKKKPPDADTVSLKKQALLLEEVQKLNQQNAERSGRLVTPEPQGAVAGQREEEEEESAADRLGFILGEPRAPVAEQEECDLSEEEEEESQEPRETATTSPVFSEPEESEEQTGDGEEGDQLKAEEVEGEEEEEDEEEEEEDEEEEEEEEEGKEEIAIKGPADSEVIETEEAPPAPENVSNEISPSVLESYDDPEVGGAKEVTASSSKRRVTEEDLLKDDLKKSRVEEGEAEEEEAEEEEGQSAQPEGVEEEPEKQEEEEEVEPLPKEYIIDCSPPPPAPFDHRVVASKPHMISNFYTINREEILGGGRFGQVHKCVENSSGLTLAAKIIKARSLKEKEVIRNEIQVMNQLDHANLIQLYAAYESRHDIILVMEYVDGGELFDRIIDENYNLTELDTVLFIRQITEGLQYMHQMYILHLDLKPENILCVSRSTNKIKIIDFGLARRYKPREKLRVNFGTPEFLAPEVINYEFVSFPTDMWSLGVITYMLLSGLSPFLGEDDNETLNNILACQWNFEEEEFTDISEEAKDFITRLLVKSKSWRMSATESLKHPWLSDRGLHYRLHQKGNKCHSTHTPPPES